MYNGQDDKQAVSVLDSCIWKIMSHGYYCDADCAAVMMLFHAREYLLEAESDFERARR